MQAIEKESSAFRECYFWLEKSMSGDFFSDVGFEDIILITHNLIGLHLQNYESHINLKDGAIVLCLEDPQSDVRILEKYKLYGIKYYCTYRSHEAPPIEGADKKLCIVILQFSGIREQGELSFSEEDKKKLKLHIRERNKAVTDEEFEKIISQMNSRFLATLPFDKVTLAMDMFFRAQTRDNCQYEVRYNEDWERIKKPSIQIVLAWKNTSKANFLYHVAKLIYRHHLIMKTVHAAYINPHTAENILVMVIGLQGSDDQPAWEKADIPDLLKELVTVKYFAKADAVDQLLVEPGIVTGNFGNYLRASSHFIHQILLHVDSYQYTPESIEAVFCLYPDLMVDLCHIFESRFHPEKKDDSRYEELKNKYSDAVQRLDTGKENIDVRHKNILSQALHFVVFTLKTNFYRNNKSAFSFRLDPEYLNHLPFDRKDIFPVIPYGIFYIKGASYFAFHIRFKDLARGGLRTVVPKRKEFISLERNEVFMENYSLALTQQKKNKDIPEGGAKGVIFLEVSEALDLERASYARELRAQNLPETEIEKKMTEASRIVGTALLHQAQRSFVDALLTLINCEPDGALKAKHIVSYYAKPEYVYLGPDENLGTEIIEWIAQYSSRRGYKPGSAFISSKPGIGINHKEHGVTSLGVNVCMHEVLKYLGINPEKDSFTVKMSGGPDGDVAGNQMLNLKKFYPNTAKLLATIDVSGTIFDPEGLDLNELESLFKQEKPIGDYPPDKLHEGGFLLDTREKQEESAYVQKTLCYRKKEGKLVKDWLSGNEMNHLLRHNVHRTQADIFIPCGGRPATLNTENYGDFLNDRGEPTAKAIIEGANLYLTPQARKELESKGVLIIKDSSANKGGVIASSYEILSGLVLNDEEMGRYHENIIQETLAIIKKRAEDEARLLLKTHQEQGTPLTEVSEKISQKINFYTYQILDHLEAGSLSDDLAEPLHRCFLAYCPAFLRDDFRERLSDIPDLHKKAIISCYLGSKIVYKMGIQWSPTLVGLLPVLLADPEICPKL